MDFAIDISSDGYATGRMTFEPATDGNLLNNLYLSLEIQQGSFFVDPAFGSRLYLLRREKNLERIAALAVDYVKEATQWIIDEGKAVSIDVVTERDTDVTGRLKCLVTATKANGSQTTFEKWVEVV